MEPIFNIRFPRARDAAAAGPDALAPNLVMLYASFMHNSAATAVDLTDGKSTPKAERRVVLKFGSRLLTGDTNALDPTRMASVARIVASEPTAEVVIVSSGAIAAGFRTLGHSAPPKKIQDRQAAAAVGQGAS